MVVEFYDKLGLINKLDIKHDVDYDKSDGVNKSRDKYCISTIVALFCLLY